MLSEVEEGFDRRWIGVSGEDSASGKQKSGQGTLQLQPHHRTLPKSRQSYEAWSGGRGRPMGVVCTTRKQLKGSREGEMGGVFGIGIGFGSGKGSEGNGPEF